MAARPTVLVLAHGNLFEVVFSGPVPADLDSLASARHNDRGRPTAGTLSGAVTAEQLDWIA